MNASTTTQLIGIDPQFSSKFAAWRIARKLNKARKKAKKRGEKFNDRAVVDVCMVVGNRFDHIYASDRLMDASTRRIVRRLLVNYFGSRGLAVGSRVDLTWTKLVRGDENILFMRAEFRVSS